MKGYTEQQIETVTSGKPYGQKVHEFQMEVRAQFKKLLPRSEWNDYFLPDEATDALITEECLSGHDALTALKNVLKKLGRY